MQYPCSLRYCLMKVMCSSQFSRLQTNGWAPRSTSMVMRLQSFFVNITRHSGILTFQLRMMEDRAPCTNCDGEMVSIWLRLIVCGNGFRSERLGLWAGNRAGIMAVQSFARGRGARVL